MTDHDLKVVLEAAPESIARFNEALKTHESQYRTLLTLCGFGLITFISINDRDLILHNNSTSNLPIVNIPITVNSLIWVLPMLISSIFIYYCIVTFNLMKERKSLIQSESETQLNAEAKSGTTKPDFKNQAYESMLKNFFGKIDDLEQNYQLLTPILVVIKTAVLMFYWGMLFAIPPLTLFAFWIISLKKHDQYLSFFQICFFLISLYLSILILCKSLPSKMKGHVKSIKANRVSFELSKKAINPAYYLPDLIFFILSCHLNFNIFVLFAIAFMIMIELLGIHLYFSLAYKHVLRDFIGPTKINLCVTGFIASIFYSEYVFTCNNPRIESIQISESTREKKARLFPDSIGNTDPIQFWPLTGPLLNLIDCNPFLNLRNATLSNRPEQWTDEPKDEETQIKLVKGADLRGLDLRGADAERSFLARSNLRGADLRGIHLRGANLCYADLRNAKLDGAYIRIVNFRNADLRNTDFGNEVFVNDINDPTKVIGPNFQGARFDFTKFKENERFFPKSLLPNEKELNQEDLRYKTKNLPLAYMGLNSVEDLKNFQNSVIGIKLNELGFTAILDKHIGNKSINNVNFSKNFSLEDAILDKHDLSDSTFVGVNLKKAQFIGASLKNSSFKNANLRNANFTNANFDHTSFESSDLRNANFSDVDLKYTNFKNANYSGAIFKNCKNADHVYPKEVRDQIIEAMRQHGLTDRFQPTP